MRIIDQLLNHFDDNQSKVARAFEKKQQHVFHWKKPGKDLPLHLVPKAADILGKKPSDLRPDVFRPGS